MILEASVDFHKFQIVNSPLLNLKCTTQSVIDSAPQQDF